MAQYYDGTDFYNFGYWETGTKTQAQASENLVRKLLAFVPVKRLAILDVACGKEATTDRCCATTRPSRSRESHLGKAVWSVAVKTRRDAPSF